jgi:hypothetical protein
LACGAAHSWLFCATRSAESLDDGILQSGTTCGIGGQRSRLAGMKDLPGLHLKRPAPGLKPRVKAMIDGIRAAGAVSYRTFATARERERLLADGCVE